MAINIRNLSNVMYFVYLNLLEWDTMESSHVAD